MAGCPRPPAAARSHHAAERTRRQPCPDPSTHACCQTNKQNLAKCPPLLVPLHPPVPVPVPVPSLQGAQSAAFLSPGSAQSPLWLPRGPPPAGGWPDRGERSCACARLAATAINVCCPPCRPSGGACLYACSAPRSGPQCGHGGARGAVGGGPCVPPCRLGQLGDVRPPLGTRAQCGHPPAPAQRPWSHPSLQSPGGGGGGGKPEPPGLVRDTWPYRCAPSPSQDSQGGLPDPGGWWLILLRVRSEPVAFLFRKSPFDWIPWTHLQGVSSSLGPVRPGRQGPLLCLPVTCCRGSTGTLRGLCLETPLWGLLRR